MIYTLVFNKMLQKLSNKQSTMSMKSEAFKKKNTHTQRISKKFTHFNTNITGYTEDA